MIAYLEKYDTTVEVPDDIGDKDLADINNNFHSYVDKQPQTDQPAQKENDQALPGQVPPVDAAQKWQPNFYEGAIKPALANILKPASALASATESPEAQAFAGKALEEGTFGLTKPLTSEFLAQDVKDHPAYAAAGQMAGGIGSLLATGGALKIAGLGVEAGLAGKAAVEAGFEAGSRFIPRAIMTGATFGTRTFIAETVKAFEDGGVNLQQFGEHVLKDTAFGSIFGAIGGVSNVAASVSSAGALGFISSKMDGADNREASLNGAIWAAFETIGSAGKSTELRLEALKNLKESIGEYVGERNPGLHDKDAAKVASDFVDHAVRKAGFDNAEDLAKSGPENLLEGIEKVNQAVRNAKIPAQAAPTEVLPKLPVSVEPEVLTPDTVSNPETKLSSEILRNESDEALEVYAKQFNDPRAQQELLRRKTEANQSPIDKMIENVKGMLGIKPEPEAEPKPIEVKGDTYEEKIQSLKDQGHDISKMPESAFPEDMKDVYHFEQGKAQRADIEKGLGEIAERFQALGIKPNEGASIFEAYGLAKTGSLGQHAPLTDLVNQPIEDQYKTAYQALAQQRGIDKGDKFDSRTMEDATKAVDLINAYVSPKSQNVLEFAKQHQEHSDHDVAQMAYDRGLLDEPNNDLLKMEIQKAKQEKPIINAQITMPGQLPGRTIPKERVPSNPIIPEEVSGRIKEAADEITHIVNPTSAAPLAAQITRESLGKMARSYDMAEASLESAKKFFDSQPKEKNIEFIDRLERGKLQDTKSLDDISSTLRKLLDDKRKEIQALGTGKMQSFIENYFPHIWDQGEKEVGQVVQKAAKRPFEGSKSFLKKRKIEFTKDGIEMGLTPISFNPVDLALLKIREMDKYLMAHRTIQEYKKNGLAKYIKVGGEVPDGWQKIDDKISTVFKSPMVAVKEGYDAKVMQGLTDVAKNLGVDLERSTHKPKEAGLSGEFFGLSSGSADQAGKIWTMFGGPESTLAHELGHQLDNIYGLQRKFLSNEKINGELTELAKERIPENGSTKSFEKYIQTAPEKMAVMLEAYIHAPDLMQEKAPETFKALEKFLASDEKLKPLTEIEPSLVKVMNKSEVNVGGAVIAGHIYAQPDAARIINNYLSPGLQKSSIYQAYRYAGNLMNQFQLSLSAFHLGFTTMESSVSKFALAIKQLADGHPINAIKAALETPFASVTNIIRGDSLLKAWRGDGKNGIDNVLAEAMASAGGRARMDQFYATNVYDQMKHHFQAGNIIRGVLHVPLLVADATTKPILEWAVPRMKLGIFSDMMKMEMENNPNMTHAQVREIAQKAWDSVDNRMGQMVYDNLFWNRTFKDLLMGSVRSVGWNLGTLRELTGGAADYVEALSQAARGKKTEFSYRMAYFAALPIVVGTLGAMVQYLRTGKGPQELKDYYYPKTGGVDAHGEPTRISLPSYMKDVFHYSQGPVKTVTDKLSPLISTVIQMMENKDYFGVKIRNEDDPLVKQVSSEIVYMLKQAMPFSVKNMQKNLETGNKSLFDTVGPWVGISPAPYDINQTKAEKLAHEIAASHQEIGGRTQEQADRSRLINDLSRQYRMGDPKASDNLYQAYQTGLISHRQMQEVITNANLTPLQKMVKHFTLPEAERVYAKANDEEKGQLESILRKKMANQESEFVPQ